MTKKKKEFPKKEQPITRADDYSVPHFDGDYYDRFGQRRNSLCRGCPFDGQCTTCLED